MKVEIATETLKTGRRKLKKKYRIKIPYEVGLSFCFGADQRRRNGACGVRIFEL